MARLFPMSAGTTQVKSFTSNQTFPMPAGITSISVTGKGAAGSPAVDGEEGLLERKVVKIYQSGVLQSTTTTYKTYPNYSAPKPADECFNESDSSGYRKETCYYHTYYDDDRAATTGASATGFTKTFPGGYAGPATPVTYDNVAVIPGTSYSVVVPPGGSITITYIS